MTALLMCFYLTTPVAIVTYVIYTSGMFLHFPLQSSYRENVTINRQKRKCKEENVNGITSIRVSGS